MRVLLTGDRESAVYCVEAPKVYHNYSNKILVIEVANGSHHLMRIEQWMADQLIRNIFSTGTLDAIEYRAHFVPNQKEI